MPLMVISQASVPEIECRNRVRYVPTVPSRRKAEEALKQIIDALVPSQKAELVNAISVLADFITTH